MGEGEEVKGKEKKKKKKGEWGEGEKEKKKWGKGGKKKRRGKGGGEEKKEVKFPSSVSFCCPGECKYADAERGSPQKFCSLQYSEPERSRTRTPSPAVFGALSDLRNVTALREQRYGNGAPR